MTCSRCGSFAINENSHGRVKGFQSDLCDVCYWRAIADDSNSGKSLKFDRMEILLKAMVDIVKKLDNTPYVLNFFEQTADCDEYRLFEEAKEVLQIED